MKTSINWNTTIYFVIVVSFLILWLSVSVLKDNFLTNKDVVGQRNILWGQIISLKSLNDVTNQQWDILLTWSWKTIDLAEWKEVEIKIPKSIISTTWSLLISYSWGWNVWINYEWYNDNELKENSSYSLTNGLTISDASFWTSSERLANRNLQQYYLNNRNLQQLWIFQKWEINKLGVAWSYVLFDFWKKQKLNSFTLNLTNKIQNTSRNIPQIIALSFDNGAIYYYFVDDANGKQKFIFEDTITQFVKLDVLKTTSSTYVTQNIAPTGIARELLASEIWINQSITGQLSLWLSPISTISWVKFYNVYLRRGLTRDEKPIVSKLKSDTTISVQKSDVCTYNMLGKWIRFTNTNVSKSMWGYDSVSLKWNLSPFIKAWNTLSGTLYLDLFISNLAITWRPNILEFTNVNNIRWISYSWNMCLFAEWWDCKNWSNTIALPINATRINSASTTDWSALNHLELYSDIGPNINMNGDWFVLEDIHYSDTTFENRQKVTNYNGITSGSWLVDKQTLNYNCNSLLNQNITWVWVELCSNVWVCNPIVKKAF